MLLELNFLTKSVSPIEEVPIDTNDIQHNF